MTRPAGGLDPRFARIVTALAAIVALSLAIALPVAYYTNRLDR
jgi:hypothetical protein